MDEVKIQPAHLVIALLVALLAFTLGYSAGGQGQATRTIIVQSNQTGTSGGLPTSGGASISINATPSREPLEKLALLLPAVDQQRRGAIATLEVERTNGTGRAFMNFDEDRPAIADATQTSIKNAIHVAKLFDQNTGRRFSESDIFYIFKANSLEVSGGSAGAATAVATIALLNGRRIKDHYAITGTVNKNGSIGIVGEVLEKARALKRTGVTTFLVPLGESIQENSVANGSENCTEEVIGNDVFRSCTTQTTVQPVRVNVSQETGVNVIEVRDVATAYGIMVQ